MTLDRDNLEGVDVEVMDENELMKFVQACSHACYNLEQAYKNSTLKTNGLDYTPILTANEIKLKFAAIRKKGIEAWQAVKG